MAEAVYAICGVVIGALIGWFIAHAASRSEKQLAGEYKMQANDLSAELEKAKLARIGAEAEVNTLKSLRAEDEKRHNEKLAEIEKAETRLKAEFKALAGDTLQQVLSTHQETARGEMDERRKAIEALSQPIKEKLTELQNLLTSSDKSRGEQFVGLHKDIENLLKAKTDLQQTTDALANALRRKPGERGRWGELQLHNVIEIAGMQKFCDFTEQETAGGGRPDVTVRLPNKGLIAIDAKVTLEQFVQATATKDANPEEFRAYAQAVKTRVIELSKRDYADKLGMRFDYVILFIGHDASYDVAVEFEPELIRFAAEQKVIIATPASLIGVLRAIWIGWQEVHLAENAQAIRELGENLYESLRVWSGHMGKLRKSLKDSVEAYDSAVGSLERNVLPKARRFPALGTSAKGEIEPLDTLALDPRSVSAEDRAGD